MTFKNQKDTCLPSFWWVGVMGMKLQAREFMYKCTRKPLPAGGGGPQGGASPSAKLNLPPKEGLD
jgi:hypothetical protein